MGLFGRRLFAITLTVALIGISILSYAVLAVMLHDTQFLSGWALFTLIMLLTLFNLRKKLPFFPLASAAIWLHGHVYGSMLALAIFLIHNGLRLPGGGLETLLTVLFYSVFISGLMGLWLSRRLPKRLTTRGESILFERLPIARRELADSVEQLVLQSIEQTESKLIADFYRTRLLGYFSRPRYFFGHIIESDRPRQALLAELDDLHRYANNKEQEILRLLSGKVIEKSRLDYQYALQRLLKAWLFVHIPLSYSLLLTIGLHIFVGYRYHGS
jgi:hypothetical protein